jgi:RimJ/RimL family protein N-acetyltransferase
VPTLRGERVTLRPPDPVIDAHDYFEMNLDPDMHTWTGSHLLESEAEARTELERFISMDDISTWMIVDNPSGRVVGRFFLCLEDRDGIRVVGEGNRIAKPYWRKGHNREARMLLFAYAFGDLQADVIETGAWSTNTNSLKSIESYGFKFSQEERKWNDKHGQLLIMRYYTMTREQWETTAKQAFEATS